jgi:hypothetical protein
MRVFQNIEKGMQTRLHSLSGVQRGTENSMKTCTEIRRHDIEFRPISGISCSKSSENLWPAAGTVL